MVGNFDLEFDDDPDLENIYDDLVSYLLINLI